MQHSCDSFLTKMLHITHVYDRFITFYLLSHVPQHLTKPWGQLILILMSGHDRNKILYIIPLYISQWSMLQRTIINNVHKVLSCCAMLYQFAQYCNIKQKVVPCCTMVLPVAQYCTKFYWNAQSCTAMLITPSNYD